MKSGVKTSEFWLTMAAVVFGVLAQFGVFAPESCNANWCEPASQAVGFVVMVLAAMGYTYNRSKLKASVGNGDSGN